MQSVADRLLSPRHQRVRSFLALPANAFLTVALFLLPQNAGDFFTLSSNTSDHIPPPIHHQFVRDSATLASRTLIPTRFASLSWIRLYVVLSLTELYTTDRLVLSHRHQYVRDSGTLPDGTLTLISPFLVLISMCVYSSRHQ